MALLHKFSEPEREQYIDYRVSPTLHVSLLLYLTGQIALISLSRDCLGENIDYVRT